MGPTRSTLQPSLRPESLRHASSTICPLSLLATIGFGPIGPGRLGLGR